MSPSTRLLMDHAQVFFFFTGAVEPQFNGLLYINKVLGITNDIPAAPVIVRYL